MKKRFMGLLAMASMLFATSCSEDVVLSQSTGDEVKVTFTTELRNDVKSRAVGDDTYYIDQLQFAVYDQNEEYISTLNPTIVLSDLKEDGTRTATINVVLVKGQTYSFAFWAQNSDAAYVFDAAEATVAMNYDNANDASSDAFFAKINNYRVNGTFEMAVTMKRPFAQINFLTTDEDLEKAAEAGFEPSQSQIVVKKAAPTLNILTGEPEGNATDVTFALAALIGNETTTIKNSQGEAIRFGNDATATEFNYLATAYFLPIDAADKKPITAEMTVIGDDTKNAPVVLTAENINAQRNYRTNIYGNLLTNNGLFNVTIDPGFDDNSDINFPDTDAEKLAFAAKNGGTVELTTDVELTEPLNVVADMVLDLKGYTITTTLEKEGRHHYAINNHATMILKGANGSIEARGIQNFGTMTIDGNITITNVDTNGGAAVWNEGSLTINGGTFTTNDQAGAGSYGAALNTRPGGTAIVNGGNFIANSQFTYAIINEGTTTINDAMVKGKHGAVCGAETDDATVINGGTFELMDNPGVSDHCTYYVSEINGGAFTLGTNIDGGAQVFYESTIANGFKDIEKNGIWYVVANDVTVAATLDEVKEAFTNGGKIQLVEDIVWDNMLKIENGAEVVLDMNGKTIEFERDNTFKPGNPIFYPLAGTKLTITGNGTVDLGNNYDAALVFPAGEVVIENGTFIRNRVPAGTSSDDVQVLFMGVKSVGSKLTINGGYFDSGYYDENAADIEEILNGTKTYNETDNVNRGKPADKDLVRTAIKNNTIIAFNLSWSIEAGTQDFKIYGGTFVGANPAWGDEGCMLPTTPNYLRPWSYYHGALLDGQTFNEKGIVLPEGYAITKGTTGDGRPTYTVTYNK